jgi:3-hydroxybutyryl-CoA dehydrogenase
MHFLNPAPLMMLVEVVRSLATSDGTAELSYNFAKALGKDRVRTNDVPGFIVSRVLMLMLNEAVFALEEGVGRPRRH